MSLTTCFVGGDTGVLDALEFSKQIIQIRGINIYMEQKYVTEMIDNEAIKANMSSSPSVKKNTFYNVIKTFSTIVFPLITFPYISRVLGAENIGKINFGSSIVSYLNLIATLGVTVYAVRECSRIKSDREKLGKIASQIISINLCTSLIAYVALAVCLANVPKLESYQLLIIIQSTSIILDVLGAEWLNTAMEDFRYITIRTFIFQLIALVFLFIFVKQKEHYIIYAIIGVISSSGANVVNIFYRRRYCKVRFTLHMDWKKHFVPIMGLFVMLLSQQVLNNLDTTMLGFIKDDMEVGLYSTAAKVNNIVAQVVYSIGWVVIPKLSLYFKEKNYTEINKILRYEWEFTLILGLPCLVAINMMAEEIIYLIAGTEYMPAANCLRILSVSMACGYISSIYGNTILLPSNREKRYTFACLVASIINAVTNALFIPLFGINGAAMTTVFASVVIMVVVTTKIEPEISFLKGKDIYFGPVLGSAAIFVVCLLSHIFIRNTILRLAVAVVVSACMYLTILVVTKNEFMMETINPILDRLKRTKK